MYIILLIILSIALVMALLWYVFSSISIAPWVPCKKIDLVRINTRANLKPGQVFFELGCGDGRVSHYIAQNNPDVHVIGIEVYLPLYVWAKVRAYFSRLNNLTITRADAHREDISSAHVVYTYALVHTINGTLKKKFERELKHGTKVLSYIFSISGWENKRVIYDTGKKELVIHEYIV